MSSNPNFFAFVPQLKPYQVIPSEEDPKEFILILDENGAALGITHTERRLIELLDGKLAVGDIVLQTADDTNLKLAAIRKLLWDLDRFGFLEGSPWDHETQDAAWGYWGIQSKPKSTFYYSWTLPLLEHWTMQFWLLVFASILFAASVDAWDDIRLGIVNESFALGILVVLFGALIGALVSAWDGARVLCTVHESPARLSMFWMSPFLSLHLDGRRLRMLPFFKSLFVCIRPVLTVLSVAALCAFVGRVSEGLRQEWLLHLSLGMILTAVWQVLPWSSTLLTRDVKLRLRGDSLFWVAWRGMRKAFQSLFQSNQETEIHGKLFLWWGIWAIISSVMLLRAAALMFRSDFPVLLSHFLSEDNALVLWIFVVVTFFIFFSIAFVIFSLLIRFVRDGYGEIRRRLFPHHMRFIARWVPILALVIAVLCMISGYHQSTVFMDVFCLTVGICIFIVSAYYIFQESGPIYTGLHCGVFTIVVYFLLHGLGISRSGVFTISQIHIGMFFTYSVIYLVTALPLFRWKKKDKQRDWNAWMKAAPLMIVFLIHWYLNSLTEVIQIIGIDVRYFVVFIEFIFGLYLINTAHTFLKLCDALTISMFILVFVHYSFPLYSGLSLLTLFFVTGVVISVYLYREDLHATVSCVRETAKPLQQNWDYAVIQQELLQGIEVLLGRPAVPTIKIQPDEDGTRMLLSKLYRMLGTQLTLSLFKRAVKEIPWQASQTLASLMPPNVPVQNLSSWDEEKVISYLRNVPTFMQVGDEIGELAKAARIQFFDKGDRIITQDRVEDDLFIIVQGKASIEAEHAFGQTRIAVMTTGDFVGEIGFLSRAARTASVWALEPVTVLVVNRNDINDTMPETQKRIQEAETGQSWLQRLHEFHVFREFPPGLLSRVCLESQHVHLEVSRTVVMHKEAFENSVAVVLSGETVLQQDEQDMRIGTGQIAGLPECILHQSVKGVVRAESPAHLLMVSRQLLHDALTELLTPKQVLQSHL